MKRKLLDMLVCPRCRGRLEYRRKQKIMVCANEGLAFPVRNGIPVLLEMDARQLDVESSR